MRKNMQKWMSKFRVGFGVMVMFYSLSAIANQQLLTKADSLYSLKKFTEASKVYEQLYSKDFIRQPRY